ncbi:MAG TPA: HD domain-containing phosphohydrolase [Streptosporangiaceae bacterium]|nr:HD domain-containing phosphohydrolase [Streptosporangiaceae bacterium]
MTGSTMAGRQAPDRIAYWQAVDSGRLLLMATAATLVTAAFAVTAVEARPNGAHHIYWTAALAFGGFIAFGELLRLALPGGRESAPIAMVGAMSYALLLAQPKPGYTKQSALLVIAVAAVGMTVGALPHIAAGRPAGVTGICARIVAVACVAFIFRPLAPEVSGPNRPWELAFSIMALLVGLGWLVDTLIGALIRADDVGAKFSVAMLDEIRLQWPLGLAVGASVIITVFSVKTMGLLVLAVFTGPLLVTQVAFRRYAGIRATYLQTVRSLARVTEVAGYVEAGHSRRVSRLAVAVGRGLGMPEPDLLALEYAALMHDIGQLSLRDPIPGGATVLVSPADQDRIAELGADVIREAGVLDHVAELVRCQSWPARGHDPEPPLGSMIIRAANAFDDMVGGSIDRDRSAAALERLRLDPDQYDESVVDALAEVAGRRVPSRL